MSKSIKSIQLIHGFKDINKAITTYKHNARSLQADLHRIASSALAHYFEHGQSALCLSLVQAMPASSRKNKLVFWFCENGGMSFEAGNFKKTNAYDLLEKELKLQQAIAVPFWKMSQKVDEDVTPEQAMNQAINRAVGIIAQLIKESGNVELFDDIRERVMKRAGMDKKPVKFNSKVQFYIDTGHVFGAMPEYVRLSQAM